MDTGTVCIRLNRCLKIIFITSILSRQDEEHEEGAQRADFLGKKYSHKYDKIMQCALSLEPGATGQSITESYSFCRR